MITKAVAYQVGEQFFSSIERAQEHELSNVLHVLDDGAERVHSIAAAQAIVANREEVLNILTMKPSSRPRARKANGATRKSRKAANAAAVNAALQDMKP